MEKVSWEIGWWKSERDKRRDREYRLALHRKQEENQRRKELLQRFALSVIVAAATVSLVMLIA